jgi:hypothetical protein
MERLLVYTVDRDEKCNYLIFNSFELDIYTWYGWEFRLHLLFSPLQHFPLCTKSQMDY